MIEDIRYILETNELEITDYYGNPTYVDMSTLEPVDANERELGLKQFLENLIKSMKN